MAPLQLAPLALSGLSQEQQMLQLQQRIKSLEAHRRESEAEEARVLQEQRSQIEQLRMENRQMQEQLNLDPKSALASLTPAQQERIDKLQDLVETYRRKVEVEGRQVEGLQQELAVTQARMSELRRLTGGPQAAAEAAKQAAKTRKTLENRLEQVEKRFGEALARNNELRKEIELQNKAREQFDQICTRLERELASKAGELESLRGATTIAEEARSTAARQVTALQIANEQEAAAAAEEVAQMEACQGADKRLLMAQAKRLAAAAEAQDVLRSQLGSTGGGGTGQGSSTTDGQRYSLEGGLSDPRSCAAAVQQLEEVSGIRGSLGELVSHFSRLDSLNFQLFSACSEANERVGALQRELAVLQGEILQAESEGVVGRQKEVIRATLAKREAALKRVEAFRDKQVLLERRLALGRAGVAAALKALGATPTLASRPEDPGNVYATLLQNLGALEARARAVVAVYSTILGRNNAGTQAIVQAQRSASASASSAAGTARAKAAAAAVAATGGASGSTAGAVAASPGRPRSGSRQPPPLLARQGSSSSHASSQPSLAATHSGLLGTQSVASGVSGQSPGGVGRDQQNSLLQGPASQVSVVPEGTELSLGSAGAGSGKIGTGRGHPKQGGTRDNDSSSEGSSDDDSDSSSDEEAVPLTRAQLEAKLGIRQGESLTQRGGWET